MDSLLGILPVLGILACPLMMWFMMRGMHGRTNHHEEQHAGCGGGSHEQRDEAEGVVTAPKGR